MSYTDTRSALQQEYRRLLREHPTMARKTLLSLARSNRAAKEWEHDSVDEWDDNPRGDAIRIGTMETDDGLKVTIRLLRDDDGAPEDGALGEFVKTTWLDSSDRPRAIAADVDRDYMNGRSYVSRWYIPAADQDEESIYQYLLRAKHGRFRARQEAHAQVLDDMACAEKRDSGDLLVFGVDVAVTRSCDSCHKPDEIGRDSFWGIEVDNSSDPYLLQTMQERTENALREARESLSSESSAAS